MIFSGKEKKWERSHHFKRGGPAPGVTRVWLERRRRRKRPRLRVLTFTGSESFETIVIYLQSSIVLDNCTGKTEMEFTGPIFLNHS